MRSLLECPSPFRRRVAEGRGEVNSSLFPSISSLLLMLCALPGLAHAQPALGRSAGLNGPQVLQHCQKAYDALHAYQGIVKVTTTMRLSGSPFKSEAVATVQFVRPDRIRVQCTQTPSGTFTLVSDGHAIWTSDAAEGGRWQPAPSMEIALTTSPRALRQAITTIPAILLHTLWGNPLVRARKAVPQVGQETIQGHFTYRVTIPTNYGEAMFWVDQKSFLLVKIYEHTDLTRMGSPTPGGSSTQGRGKAGQTSQTIDVVQTFGNVKINPALPPSTFAKPTGMLLGGGR